MKWKLLSGTVLLASLILSGQVMAAGPGGQGGGQNRMMSPSPAQKPQASQMQMERMQVRERSQGPQALLPDQASETARAAVDNAGMGETTADSVKGTREQAAVQPTPESETTGLLVEPAAGL
jgi:hypothetical protein